MALADPVQSFNLPSRTARNVAGVVFLIALLAGAVSAAWSLAAGNINKTAWSYDEFMQGDSTRKLAGELAQALMPIAMADAERAASWLIAGSLGPRVRQGCDQWLYLMDELLIHTEGASNAQRRLDAVALVRDRLRRRGVELVVATVPDKSRVQHEQLCNIYRPASLADRLGNWELGLAQHGVRYASLLPFLEAVKQQGKNQPFLKSDTHWSEAGAQVAAQAVAEVAAETGIALIPRQRYVMQQEGVQDRIGDLVRLSGIDWLPAALLPTPDKVAAMKFQVKAMGEPEEEGEIISDDAADDLFGDANLPTVALIGTSYSRTSSFTSYLEAALETPVPSFAMDGGDFWLAAKTYLASHEFRESAPRMVIWEIPERVLEMPLVPDEVVWIQDLTH